MTSYQVQIVNCYKLNVRAGAGTSHKIVAVVNRDEKYTASKLSGGWYFIDSKKGWVSGKYVKVLSTTEPAKAPVVVPPKAPPAVAPKPPTIPPVKDTTDYDSVKRIIGQSGGVPVQTSLKVMQRDKSYKPNVSEKTPPDLRWNESQNINTFGSISFDSEDRDNAYNYGLDYSEFSDDMNIIRQNYNIRPDTAYDVKTDLYNRFNRFKIPFVNYHLSKTFSYVFFTRPDLNFLNITGRQLNKQFSNDPLYRYLFDNNRKLITSLTSRFNAKHDFHPYLSNAANSFEISDEFIKTVEHGETFTGYKIQYGKNNIESNSAGQFSINYQDDSEYNIYKTHKAWTEYISRVYRGAAKPKTQYIKKRILDYAASVYYIICGPDGETILYWTKYFGVFPMNTPASASSWVKGSSAKIPEVNINYAYSMKEDFNPLSLAEFNMNSEGDYKYKRIYEQVLASTGRTLSGAPFIASDISPSGNANYKLKFRE